MAANNFALRNRLLRRANLLLSNLEVQSNETTKDKLRKRFGYPASQTDGKSGFQNDIRETDRTHTILGTENR